MSIESKAVFQECAAARGSALTPSAELTRAVLLADVLRRSHNGIGGVYLYLGHDGGNACELKDIDGEPLAKASSGRSLVEAVERAQIAWSSDKWRKAVPSLISDALAGFNDSPCRIFNTANFQAAVRERFCYTPDSEEVVEALSRRPEVVRLSGGCHWFVLPPGVSRHE